MAELSGSHSLVQSVCFVPLQQGCKVSGVMAALLHRRSTGARAHSECGPLNLMSDDGVLGSRALTRYHLRRIVWNTVSEATTARRAGLGKGSEGEWSRGYGVFLFSSTVLGRILSWCKLAQLH